MVATIWYRRFEYLDFKWYYRRSYRTSTIQLRDFLSVIQVTIQLSDYFWPLGYQTCPITQCLLYWKNFNILGMSSGARIFEYINLTPTIRRSGGKTIPYHSFFGDIEFKNVSFTYPTRPDQIVIDNLSLKIKGGQMVSYISVGIWILWPVWYLNGQK